MYILRKVLRRIFFQLLVYNKKFLSFVDWISWILGHNRIRFEFICLDELVLEDESLAVANELVLVFLLLVPDPDRQMILLTQPTFPFRLCYWIDSWMVIECLSIRLLFEYLSEICTNRLFRRVVHFTFILHWTYKFWWQSREISKQWVIRTVSGVQFIHSYLCNSNFIALKW